MATTFVKIASVTVGAGGAASIEFTSIPQTYIDLQVLFSIRSARVDTDDTYYLDFNSYAGTNLSSRRLVGNGSTAASASNASQISWTVNAANNTASVFGNSMIYIPNYASSNNKSVSIDTVTENNGTTAFAILAAGLWASSSAITSLKIYSANAQNTAQYSTAVLYGIKSS